MGKRELIALLNLSSWCLVMVERLFLTVPRGCLQFVIVVFPDHTHLLFYNCSMFCCALLCVHSSIAIILMRKRELIALLYLSSWCLVVVERVFLTVPRGCLQFVIVVFPDHTFLLFLKANHYPFKKSHFFCFCFFKLFSICELFFSVFKVHYLPYYYYIGVMSHAVFTYLTINKWIFFWENCF